MGCNVRELAYFTFLADESFAIKGTLVKRISLAN